MKTETGPVELGEFMLPSGVVRVTDPCYDRSTWCAGELKVKPGKWHGATSHQDEGDWGVHVKELYAYHETADVNWATQADEDTGIDVGVDSGQAGFFSTELYPKSEESRGEFDDERSFYGKVCAMTSGKHSGGVITEGVVTSSGLGDGSYRCYVAKNSDGEIVGMRVDFIPEEEDDQDDADFDEETDE